MFVCLFFKKRREIERKYSDLDEIENCDDVRNDHKQVRAAIFKLLKTCFCHAELINRIHSLTVMLLLILPHLTKD